MQQNRPTMPGGKGDARCGERVSAAISALEVLHVPRVPQRPRFGSRQSA
jgi:hypothetical protein